MSKASRRELAKLPFSEKLKILAKLRDRSLAIAGARRKAKEAAPSAQPDDAPYNPQP
jgi:hypothetical protein